MPGRTCDRSSVRLTRLGTREIQRQQVAQPVTRLAPLIAIVLVLVLAMSTTSVQADAGTPRAGTADAGQSTSASAGKQHVPPSIASKSLSGAAPTVFGMSASSNAATQSAESRLGLTAGVVGVFTDWNHPFPTHEELSAKARGAVLLISWEPHDSSIPGANQPLFNLDQIRMGVYDLYINGFARAAAATGRPILVRWAPEMNGDWLPWSTGVNGNGPGDYASTYRYIVDHARAAGATNIRWVFNPITSYGGSTPLSELYPGDSYVDWAALDGYNWGSLRSWGWQSFTDIFTEGLTEIRSVAPTKPLAITELGSAPGPRKPAWITDAFTRAREAGVRMLVWFERNKETDWRLSSDRAAATAAHAAVTAPGWVTGGNYAAIRTALGL